MSESERRRKYRYDRVLIESDRILNPQFDDAVVYLTGAQVEMLRNVSLYLNRLDTYVDEYNPGYYLTPDSADYDDILEIVADLEETLMGNPNTIFGYDTTLSKIVADTVVGAGTKTLYLGVVPANTLWRIESLMARNIDTSVSLVEIEAATYGGDYLVWEQENPAINERIDVAGPITLRPGEQIRIHFYACADGDHIRAFGRGYTMVIP